MKKIKSFKLFESLDDVKDIVSVIKDMLLELDFLDIERRVDIVNQLEDLNQSPEIIVINLWKKAIKIEGDYHYKPSYTWDDVKDVVVPVMEHLESEGFKWHKNKGTLAYNGCPIISTSGSVQFDTVKSKVEMWFIR
jgi:hypothetical protein